MTRKGSPKRSRGTNVEMCTLVMKSPSVCCWNRPWREREMLSLLSAGLTLLPVRRKGKERTSHVSPAFYGARGVLEWNSIGHSHWMKCMISKLNGQSYSRTK